MIISSKYQESSVFVANSPDFVQVSRFRLDHSHRFHYHRRNFARMALEDTMQAIQVVICERFGKLAHSLWDPAVPGGSPHIPVLPAVIAATCDDIAPGNSTGQPHSPEVTSDPFLPKRTISAQGISLTSVSLTSVSRRMRQGKDSPFLELPDNSFVDILVSVSQGKGA